MSPCYARDHNHSLGYGPWMQQGFHDTVQSIRAATVDQGWRPHNLIERIVLLTA